MPLAAGSRVGAYEILGPLGSGGMGEVYRARDPRLGREVALKVLPDAFGSDPERRARFDREARALACLNHPHVAHVYGVEESGATRALVMELVAGETLDARIARGPIPLDEALDIARQIGEALDAVHEQEVLHRDLKPSNVILRPDGVVKVLDFGLAKIAGALPARGEESTLAGSGTRPGAVLGTAAYMSPEQARGQRVDKRTDIWSFGCVLYEMLTGRRAFFGDTRPDTIAAVLEHDPDWGALAGPLPPHVRRLLRHCLEKDPRRRLRDIGDAVHELAADQGPAGAREEPPRRHGARTAIAWAGTLTLVGALGAALWLRPRQETAPPEEVEAQPLTTYPGIESAPSLSPDGNQVAFVWNGEREDNFDVYVKLVGPGTPLRLTSDPALDASPAWSPDGRFIAFLRVLPEGRAAVMLIPALGGPERKLGETPGGALVGAPELGPWLTWSADSGSLILVDRPSATEPAGLFSWSVATGERRRLTTLPPKAWLDVGPALSPDGRLLAFARFVGFGIGDLYLLPLDAGLRPGGEAKRLTGLNRFTTSPAWMPDGRTIVFGAGSLTGGSVNLFAVDAGAATPARPRRLAAVGEHAGMASIARLQGGRSRMVYARSQFDSGIWQATLPADEAPRAVPTSIPFLLSTRPEYLPQYSPDGERVAFVSAGSGEAEIWVCDGRGANLVQLTSAGWPETAAPRWSPDGSRISFHARPEGPGDIFVVAAGGGAPQRVTDDPADDWGASWSPDGQWIFFTSNRSGRYEVWKTRVGGGTPAQVSRNGGVGPTPSHDGAQVFYAKGTELWRVSADGSADTRILESVGDWSRVAVTADGIFFTPGRPPLVKGPSPHTIEFFTFPNGPLRTVARFDQTPYLGLTVSPDRRRLLYTQIDRTGTDLMLVDDFR